MSSIFGDTSHDRQKIEGAIRKNYGWEESEKWSNTQFRTLQKNIQEITGNQISVDVLKRVFNGSNGSTQFDPQMFTKITLNRFVKSITPAEEQKINPNEQFLPDKKSLNWAAIAFLAILGLVIVLSAIFGGR